MLRIQSEFHLAQTEDSEDEQAREERLHHVLLRHMLDAADEIGRKKICYGLDISEQLIGKQLREIDEKRPSYKMLAYLIRHQQSGRLARWLMADYAGFCVPRRVERLKPAEALSEVLALALSGEMGNAAKQKVIDIYEKTKRIAEEE